MHRVRKLILKMDGIQKLINNKLFLKPETDEAPKTAVWDLTIIRYKCIIITYAQLLHNT